MQVNKEFVEVWRSLTDLQRRYIAAMARCNTKGEAARQIGIKPNTVYKWGPEVDRALALARADIFAAAWEELRSTAILAARAKTEGLALDDERIKQQVASEILDRTLGRARLYDPKSINDGELEIRVTYVDESID